MAFGDSIGSGYELENPETEFFLSLVVATNEVELSNLAVPGTASLGLLSMLDDKATEEAIREADVITIIISGNDLMEALYTYLGASVGTSAEKVCSMFTKEACSLSFLTLMQFMISDPYFSE